MLKFGTTRGAKPYSNRLNRIINAMLYVLYKHTMICNIICGYNNVYCIIIIYCVVIRCSFYCHCLFRCIPAHYMSWNYNTMFKPKQLIHFPEWNFVNTNHNNQRFRNRRLIPSPWRRGEMWKKTQSRISNTVRLYSKMIRLASAISYYLTSREKR